MLNDQFGRPLAVGDTVIVKGSVVSLTEGNPDYINCVVKLDQPMPPSGAETSIQVNTRQVEKTPGEEKHKEPAGQQQPEIRPEPKAPPYTPPSHITSKEKETAEASPSRSGSKSK